jgi:hypothetical protein
VFGQGVDLVERKFSAVRAWIVADDQPQPERPLSVDLLKLSAVTAVIEVRHDLDEAVDYGPAAEEPRGSVRHGEASRGTFHAAP